MNIAALIKQVPDTGARLRLPPGKAADSGPAKAIDEEGLKWVISPYDEFALEEALRLKPLLADGSSGGGKDLCHKPWPGKGSGGAPLSSRPGG